MTVERTFSIIKPDSIAKNIVGKIFSRIEEIGLCITGIKMLHLTIEQANIFYNEHSKKDFFNKLINFMISGPIIVSVLEGENAILRYRNLIGSTDPKNATLGTLRAKYANNITENSIHGSDSIESAEREISYFFYRNEVFNRNLNT